MQQLVGHILYAMDAYLSISRNLQVSSPETWANSMVKRPETAATFVQVAAKHKGDTERLLLSVPRLSRVEKLLLVGLWSVTRDMVLRDGLTIYRISSKLGIPPKKVPLGRLIIYSDGRLPETTLKF